MVDEYEDCERGFASGLDMICQNSTDEGNPRPSPDKEHARNWKPKKSKFGHPCASCLKQPSSGPPGPR
jgi:hypothetical protein